MMRGWLQALLIKYNQNNMVEIDKFIYMVLYWNILVQYQSQISIQLQNYVNVTQGFTFLSGGSKQDAANNTSHRKRLIVLLKDGKY